MREVKQKTKAPTEARILVACNFLGTQYQPNDLATGEAADMAVAAGAADPHPSAVATAKAAAKAG